MFSENNCRKFFVYNERSWRVLKKKIMALLVFSILCSLAAPSFAANKVYKIKLAYLPPEAQSTHIGARDYFKKYVEEKSKGQIIVELYPNGVLGGDRQVIEAVQLGTIHMTIPAAAVLSGFEPKFQVLDFPYLFKDKASAYRALDGDLGKKLNSLLLPLGMRNLVFAENGFRHTTNNRAPIYKPEDMKGLKIRTMESPVHIASFKALGANPTPMNFGELYTALQQKTVDAMECPIPLIYTSKFYEVQRYCSLTGHFYAATAVLINENYFQSLPKDLQKIIQDGANLFRKEQRKLSEKQDSEMLEALKKAGMKVNDITPEQKKLFINATQPVYREFKKLVGQDLLDMARKANK